MDDWQDKLSDDAKRRIKHFDECGYEEQFDDCSSAEDILLRLLNTSFDCGDDDSGASGMLGQAAAYYALKKLYKERNNHPYPNQEEEEATTKQVRLLCTIGPHTVYGMDNVYFWVYQLPGFEYVIDSLPAGSDITVRCNLATTSDGSIYVLNHKDGPDALAEHFRTELQKTCDEY